MAPRKHPITKMPGDKPKTPQELIESTADGERCTPRVVLRSGSPKPPTRVVLRCPKTNYTLLTPPPNKTGASPGSTLRTRPAVLAPAKVPWVSPTVKIPACHGRKPSVKRAVALEAEKSPTRTPARRSPSRYSIISLLALRPSHPQGSQRNLDHPSIRHPKEEDFNSTQNRFTEYLPLDGMLVNKCKDLPHYVPTRPAQEPVPKGKDFELTARSPPVCHNQQCNLETPIKQRVSSSKRCEYPVSKADDLKLTQGSSMAYHGGHRIVETPTKGLSIPNSQDHDQTAKIEDLESRIRSALSNRGQRRHLDSLRMVQSVKWDPAILACGPIVSSQPVSNEIKVPAVMVPELPRDALNSDTEYNTAEVPKSPTKTRAKSKKKDKAHEYMKSITELKKGDRRKLLQLLEALRNIDSDDSSDTDTGTAKAVRKPRKFEDSNSGSKLNPEAPVFKNFSQLKVAGPPQYRDAYKRQPSLNVPRRRPHVSDENHNPYEPVWHKTVDHVPGAKRQGLSDPQSENVQSLGGNRLKSLPLQRPYAPRAPRAHYQPRPPIIPRNPCLPQLCQVLPPPYDHHLPRFAPADHIPYAPCAPRFPIVQQQPRVDTRLPVINIATGRIPIESGTGRSAQALDPIWAHSILNQFTGRYPLTGNLKAAPPVPIQNRHAATIQQRLEYLLMEQKEKKAREKLSANTALKPAEQKTTYQLEKEVLARIFDLFDEKDLDMKEDEEKTEKVVGERISEASTCIDDSEELQETRESLEGGSVNEDQNA